MEVVRVGRPVAISVVCRLLLVLLLTLPGLLPRLARAQSPTITARNPVRNARSGLRAGPVAVTFSQNMGAASASNLKVFGFQAGGKKAGTYSTATNTITFAATVPFRAGERVDVTVPATVQSATGAAATKQVYQFTAATANSTGNFVSNSTATAGNNPSYLATGDLDGDGDLDLAITNGDNSSGNSSSTVSIRLNTGLNSGTYAGGSEVPVGKNPGGVVLGDVDNDGDLDLLVINTNSIMVNVRLNTGNGTFVNGTDVAKIQGFDLTLGDVDADGDLDLVTASFGAIAVRLNNGSGVFDATVTNDLPAGTATYGVALGDIDGDGDLDLVASDGDNNLVRVYSNNGSGSFTATATISAYSAYNAVALADTDGDGDLDLLVNEFFNYATEIFTNSGVNSGSFVSTSTRVSASNYPSYLAVGDVNSDGTLDLLITNSIGTVSVALNTAGTFGTPVQYSNGGTSPNNIALGDVNGDGTLDFVLPNSNALAGAAGVAI